jgi:hypothetical protein
VIIRYAMADVPFNAALRQLLIGKLGGTWIASIVVAAVAALLYAAGVEVWILWFGLGQFVLMATTTVAVWIVARRRWREKANLAGAQPAEVGAGASGLHSRSGLGETRVAWALVRQVHRFPAYWLIHFRTTDDVVVIPTTAMTPQFRDTFNRHANTAGIRVAGR